MKEIVDAFGRSFKTLRVSLTNTCNLGCVYCVDESTPSHTLTSAESAAFTKSPSLSVEQYLQAIGKLHQILGLETIRLTGGEPTLYRELVPLVQGISQLGIENIKMTSNAYLLANKAVNLQKAGLRSVNVSLDAIDTDVFFAISRRRNLGKILEGIEQCLRVGIHVKINCVVMKDVNHNQITKLLRYAMERNISIRFLELMQMGHLYHNFDQHFFSEDDILKTLAQEFNFLPLGRDASATAKYWMLENGFQFGIISNESDPFCNDCNRLRLDSDGNIFGCLSDNTPISLADCLDDDTEIQLRLQKALQQKKMKFSGSPLSMLAIGG